MLLNNSPELLHVRVSRVCERDAKVYFFKGEKALDMYHDGELPQGMKICPRTQVKTFHNQYFDYRNKMVKEVIHVYFTHVQKGTLVRISILKVNQQNPSDPDNVFCLHCIPIFNGVLLNAWHIEELFQFYHKRHNILLQPQFNQE